MTGNPVGPAQTASTAATYLIGQQYGPLLNINGRDVTPFWKVSRVR